MVLLQWRDPGVRRELEAAGWRVGSARVDLDAPSDRTLLGPDEQLLLARMSHPRRRAEFVAGRLAARRALSELDPALGRAEILPDPDGRPRAAGPSGPAISITHGRTWAFAVVAPGAAGVGIDHCDLGEAARVRALALRFLAAEPPLLRAPTDCVACWAALEAGLKALGLGLVESGLLDRAPRVRVISLDPPELWPAPLRLALADVAEGPVALAWLPAA